jgi:hypothetical protein
MVSNEMVKQILQIGCDNVGAYYDVFARRR